VSLDAREQQALDSIRDGLASSDPALVERLTIFTRLASGEEMPTREKIHVGSRQVPPRRGFHQVMPPLLWLVTSVALIVVALVYNRGSSHDTCTSSWSTFCTGAISAANSASRIP
jgi:hypothetical protein